MPPRGLYEYLAKTFAGNLVVASDVQIPIMSMDVDTLRKLYRDIATTLAGQVLLSNTEIYNKFFVDRYSYEQFVAGFSILRELSCVTINQDRIIAISTAKVDLDNSYLWQAVKL